MSTAKTPTELAPSFGGQLLQSTDAAYDETRRVHNGLVDKHPTLIACCRGVADVADAVTMARTLGLEVAVRGGGHNVSGRATIDAGMMIDLAPMKGIHVDRKARRVHAQGGVLWKELNRETQHFGLATTGGVVGSTGIAGLTLGGGLGWLMPKYGLALDNLRSADLVLADGTVTRASADENADLFWAIRGGGGNFGIATSLEYELHDVGPTITGGLVAHPFSAAKDVLRHFRDSVGKATDDMMLAAGLLTGPDGSKLAGIVACHCGDLAAGAAATAPIKAFGSPVLDVLGPMPYTALNGMLDASFPKGALNYWKAHFLRELTDDAMDVLIERMAVCPSPMSQLLLEDFHGAVSRVPVDATACTMRVTGVNVVIVSQWTDPAETERGVAWARDTYKALTPFLGDARYVNYLGADEAGDPAAAVYGPNYARLRKIKKQYDPENFFRQNVNIQPA